MKKAQQHERVDVLILSWPIISGGRSRTLADNATTHANGVRTLAYSVGPWLIMRRPYCWWKSCYTNNKSVYDTPEIVKISSTVSKRWVQSLGGDIQDFHKIELFVLYNLLLLSHFKFCSKWLRVDCMLIIQKAILKHYREKHHNIWKKCFPKEYSVRDSSGKLFRTRPSLIFLYIECVFLFVLNKLLMILLMMINHQGVSCISISSFLPLCWSSIGTLILLWTGNQRSWFQS